MFDIESQNMEFMARRVRYISQADYGGDKGFYEHLYGRPPTEQELATFRLFLKRGNGNWTFLYLLTTKTRFKDLTLSDIYNVEINNAELFGDD